MISPYSIVLLNIVQQTHEIGYSIDSRGSIRWLRAKAAANKRSGPRLSISFRSFAAVIAVAERMSGMSGRLHDGNCCKSCWYMRLMVKNGVVLKIPDKTGHFRTLGSGRGGRGAETLQKVSHSVSRDGQGTEQGRYSLVKESAGPQRQVGREKNTGPLSIREFVAVFCTKRRDKRRVCGWEAMDWQWVTNFEESARN